MKEIYYGVCDTEELQVAMKAVQDFRTEKRKTELAIEIGRNIQEEMRKLEALGFNVYYGRIHMTDAENLQIIKS